MGSGPGKGADRGVWQDAVAGLERGEASAYFVELAAASLSARKAVAAALETTAGSAVKRALAESLGGDATPDDPAGRLLRWAMGRQEPARERSNPIARNESFLCGHCGFLVPEAPGSGVRNHCPRCLRSQHVDGPVPGDRASDCHGLMDPHDQVVAGGEVRVTFRCRRCGFERVNRLHPDWDVEPDRVDELW